MFLDFTLSTKSNLQMLLIFLSSWLDSILILSIDNKKTLLDLRYLIPEILTFDPDVQADLISYFNKLVPMNNSLYAHTVEGKDDMPAHIKSSLTNNQISLSIRDGDVVLGTWQGLYLFEHRLERQSRKIVLHFLGD